MAASVKCSRCGKEGHAAVACSKPFFRLRCSFCDRPDHDVEDCWLKRKMDWESRQAERAARREAAQAPWADVQEQRALAKATAAERRRAVTAQQERRKAEQEQRNAQQEQRKLASQQRAAAEAAFTLWSQAEKEKWEAGHETRKMLTTVMALRRVAADWKGLQSAPLPGIAAEPLVDDMQIWHFNLRGARGELQGLVLHGVLRFPPTYPCQPPELRLCTPAPHPNVSEDSEGFAVCMDMLDGSSATPYGGWSSSYCASSVLLQLQSVLFDERACLFDHVTLAQALSSAEALECPCGHSVSCPKPAFWTEEGFRTVKAKSVCRTQPARLHFGAPSKTRIELQSEAQSLCDVSTCGSEASLQIEAAKDLPARWNVHKSQTPLVCVPVALGSLAEGDLVESYFKAKGGTQSKRTDVGSCLVVSSGAASIRFRDGVKQTIPREWIVKIIGSRPIALPNATKLEAECKASADLAPLPARRSLETHATIGRVPLRLLIEVLQFSAPEDTASLSASACFFSSLSEDGLLWNQYFSHRYPSSQLTAESMADWKHCFLLEAHGIEADLVCFHTKASFQDTVLGLPVDYSVNPRTHKIDYISTTLDFLSAEAFDSGVRLSQWNEEIKDCIPLFLTPEHFARAKPRLEEAVLRLSPHWATRSFEPAMVLEVLPKLMNTMVVLLCDKGLEASDRAVDGYFLVWRLLSACVEVYGLQDEVRRRLSAFVKEEKRDKIAVPSLGDFIPLLAVCKGEDYSWATVAEPLLSEAFDRNVLWACKAHPGFSLEARNVIGQGADEDRLHATFEATKVSKRLYMFHIHFLDFVKEQRNDFFYGRPPRHVRAACKNRVKEILDVATWPGFFAACKLPCPEPAELTDTLKLATANSLRKGYHSRNTDFSRIHASGVSHILKKGESYRVNSNISNISLVLGSDSASILCGACLVYEDLTCKQIVHYGSRSAYRGAIRHSGDSQVNGKSKHTIQVDLAALPPSVNRLFLTLCACGCADLSGFKNPAIDMDDENGMPLCTYSLDTAGNSPTVVMAAIWRSVGPWQVTAIGLQSAVRCCGNYNTVKRDILGIKL